MNSTFSSTNIINEFKQSIKLALPLIAYEISFALNGFIATIMIAHLGKEELAANALVWNTYIAVILFFIGILFSISIMVSQSFGAKDNASISVCFKQGIIMAIIFSLPMMLIMWFISPILIWAKQDPVVIKCAEPFFHSLILVMLPINIVMAIEQFLIGLTKIRIVMLMNIIILPIQILFYYLFLFGKLGLPNIGIAGVGISLTISNYIIAICLITYLHFAKISEQYDLFRKWWVINWKFLSEMFRVGLPLGLMWFSEVAFFAIVAIMMGTLGVSVLAAFQIADQYLLIALVILFALSQNTTIRIGYEVGRNNRDKLQLVSIVNMMIGFGLISIFTLFYTLYPQIAISLDININAENYKDVAAHATKFFPLVGILLMVDCIRIISNGALRGLKDTNFQLLISIVGFWLIAFPAAYLLAFKLNLHGIGIWWGIIIGIFITGVALLVRFNKLAKKANLLKLVTK